MRIYTPSRIARYNSQKHTAPVDKRARARVTKRGPAAPVTLSPHRSTVLKHLNTHFEQIIAASKTLSSENAWRGCVCCAACWTIVIDAYWLISLGSRTCRAWSYLSGISRHRMPTRTEYKWFQSSTRLYKLSAALTKLFAALIGYLFPSVCVFLLFLGGSYECASNQLFVVRTLGVLAFDSDSS